MNFTTIKDNWAKQKQENPNMDTLEVVITEPLRRINKMGTMTIAWTPESDIYIRQQRAKSALWKDIATVLGISENMAVRRGQILGARLPEKEKKDDRFYRDPNMPTAVPPGHSSTWDIINSGLLCLDGMPYPTNPNTSFANLGA